MKDTEKQQDDEKAKQAEMIRAGALKRMRSKSLSSEEPSSKRSKEDDVDPMKSTPGKEEMEEKDRSARRFEDPFTKMAKDTFDLEREKAEKDREVKLAKIALERERLKSEEKRIEAEREERQRDMEEKRRREDERQRLDEERARQDGARQDALLKLLMEANKK